MVELNHKLEATTKAFVPRLTLEGLVGDSIIGTGEFELFMQQLWFRKIVFETIPMSGGGVLLASFSVSSNDKDGYRARLAHFFNVYNPSNISKVPEILQAASEPDAFQQILKKYRVVDWDVFCSIRIFLLLTYL